MVAHVPQGHVAAGQLAFADDGGPGRAPRVGLPHPEIFAALEPGATLLVNDGKIRLRVVACTPESAECEVVAGGTISNNKGVNLPDVVLPLAALTEKDREDLEFALGLGIDWLALSFVQRPDDVIEARKLLGERQVGVMVKVESAGLPGGGGMSGSAASAPNLVTASCCFGLSRNSANSLAAFGFGEPLTTPVGEATTKVPSAG